MTSPIFCPISDMKERDKGASMTLVGLLPPLCDNGNMLVDGGYSKSNIILNISNYGSFVMIVDILPVCFLNST